MVDVHTKEIRSKNMAAIKSKNTKPELKIRQALFSKGFRYRIHNNKIAGRPDLVFSKYKAVIFVHGCFWHGHENCKLFKLPNSRTEFWKNKIAGNCNRDVDNINKLIKAGWRVGQIWECSMKGAQAVEFDKLIDCLSNWLYSQCATIEIRGLVKE